LVRRINAYSQDTHDLKDFFLFMSLLRVVLIVVVTVGIVAFFIWAAVNQLEDTEDLVAVRVFDVANGQVKSFPLIGDFPADVNLRVGVLWWLLLVLLFQFILTQTPYGSYTYAVGGNPGASRAQGVSVTRIKLINFMLVGGLAGVAGLLNVARVTSVNANLGEGLELDMVAAAVIGGTLLTGGYGSVFGALLGVLIAAELRTGLVLVGVDPRIIDGARGAIIILAVIINTVVRRKKS
jgi:ribose/xylose/arabinose/galactoside ABC-type transport system permease subunit